MSLAESLGLAALRRLDPERAHGLALTALRAGLVPLPGPVTSARLVTDLAGLALPNPVGLAAGFDKNATAIAALSRAGFGFLEVGAATPLPQPGNPRPRLFRLSEDQAAINRFGFNNDGAEAIGARLAARTRTNKVSPDELAGGTFTVTNTGSRGALFDTPIINQPQVAILGTGAVVKRPIVITDDNGEDALAIRSMMYLALTYDHRLVDGADAARFLSLMKQRLESGEFDV